jgi:alpha-L-rhamnosidase
MNVTVPVGSHATIHIPIAGNHAAVSEKGRDIEQAPGVTFAGVKDGYCTVRVGQGSYRLKTEN